MTLHELAKLTPCTVPMRIYADNPHEVLINLTYSDSILAGRPVPDDEIVVISAQIHDHLPHLAVTVAASR
jgi:hypothetical protein